MPPAPGPQRPALFLACVRARKKWWLLPLLISRSELGGNKSPLTRLAEKLGREYQFPSINMNAQLSKESSESTFTDPKHLGTVGHRIHGTTIADSLSVPFRRQSTHQGGTSPAMTTLASSPGGSSARITHPSASVESRGSGL